MMTARKAGLIACQDCRLLLKASAPDARQNTLRSHCPRCKSRLQPRIPSSVSRTWALLLTATIMMFPANLYPVMTVVYLGDGTPDTIYSGIIKLAEEGMVPIAVLVFIASILVPFLKLVGIMLLLLTLHFRWRLSKTQCTVLYRIIEVIGAWSMLDLFMISILVTLVNMGTVAQVSAGPGATAFASVVVLTMLAAITFDPRLLWDLQEEDND